MAQHKMLPNIWRFMKNNKHKIPISILQTTTNFEYNSKGIEINILC